VKSQKIASATYLITSFFDDKEPLKWRLRLLSVDLASNLIKDKSRLLEEMSHLFSIAKNIGLITETNHEILVAELSKLKHEIEIPLNLGLSLEKNDKTEFIESPTQNLSNEQKNFNIKDKINQKPALKEFKEFGVVSVKKNSRQSIIMNVLKRKKEIMIKDISPLIKNCSEKTIQRELMSMVKVGVLKKIGDKRWSRYTLA